MWLLHAETGQLQWFAKKPSGGYLILSHVWGQDEQTFQDIKALEGLGGLSGASAKIRDCCTFARKRGYDWVWIDTCCIDKTSSAELSEAINSMYAWYRDSDECVAFLPDVEAEEDPRRRQSQFRRSRWFTRGWTLQELIAPRLLIFVARDWRILGTKAIFADLIWEITNIDQDVLMFRRAHTHLSVARRMSWAANRQTTREEDRAYSLLGIFDVSISTVYGEGDHAFIRLQEEILRHIPDQSIFAWGPPILQNLDALTRTVGSPGKLRMRSLLTYTPDMFADSSEISPVLPEVLARRLRITAPPPHFTLTSYGMHSHLPFLKAPGYSSGRPIWLAVLACVDKEERFIALILQPQSPETSDRFFVGASIQVAQQLNTKAIHCDGYRLVSLPTLPRRNTFLPWLPVAKLRGMHAPHRLDTENFVFPRQWEEDRWGRLPDGVRGWEGRRSNPIVAAPCEVVFPAWLAHNLNRDHGFEVFGIASTDITLRINAEDHDPQQIRLVHTALGETIGISLWACRQRSEAFPYLHVTSSLRKHSAPESEEPFIYPSEDCASEHPSHWTHCSKELHLGSWNMRLTVQTMNESFLAVVAPDVKGALSLYTMNVDFSFDHRKSEVPIASGALTVDGTTLVPDSAAPRRSLDDEKKGPKLDGTGEWVYWDGHVDGRPPKFMDASPLAGRLKCSDHYPRILPGPRRVKFNQSGRILGSSEKKS